MKISKNTEDSKKLGFKISTKEKDISLMYWIPKSHNNSFGKRFIIKSKLCSTRQNSKSISSVFKLIYIIIKLKTFMRK